MRRKYKSWGIESILLSISSDDRILGILVFLNLRHPARSIKFNLIPIVPSSLKTFFFKQSLHSA